MQKERILVVEDEVSIQTIVRTYLESAGYGVTVIDNGSDALNAVASMNPSLVILDLNLPGMDGMEVAARLRQSSEVFILMLTARGEEIDRVAGLRMGADDYMIKPFSPRELVARVEAILRRNRHRGAGTLSSPLAFAHLLIDPESYEASVEERPLDLTATEFHVLWELARNSGRVLTRNQLIAQVWGADFHGNDRVVDVYVGQVRRKLEEVTGKSLIETVRGVGYKFIDKKV